VQGPKSHCYRHLPRHCEHGNEILDSIKGRVSAEAEILSFSQDEILPMELNANYFFFSGSREEMKPFNISTHRITWTLKILFIW
jgi:hypothetical protein